jgi:chorismate dehydratase
MPLHGVERVALDASSMTSALLTRLLFTARPDRRWGDPEAECAAPEFVSADIEDGIAWVRGNDGPGPAPEAVLLIGDAALQVEPAADWSVVDLGLEWTRWTGLPFVYAVWVFQGEPIAGVAECLQRVGHSGLAGIDRIARFGPLPAGMRPEDCRRYLGHSIRYRLGSLELEGLELFRRLLDEHGLLGGAAASPLRFLNGR